MNLVDEQNRVVLGVKRGDDRLDALLEVTAVARAGQQRPHVERIDHRVGEHLGHLGLDDAARQPLGDGGLADARVADIQRVVLGAPAQHLDGALDLGLASHQGVDGALGGLAVEVDAIGFEHLRAAAVGRLAVLLVGAAGRRALFLAGRLRDAVADVAHRVEARDLLLLEEIDGVGFALREDRHQHVRTGHLAAARRLRVDRRALEHALEPRGWLGVDEAFDHEALEVVFEMFLDRLAQRLEIDAAGAQHRNCVLVLGKRHQQVLQRRVLVMPVVRQRQRVVKCLLEIGRKHGFSTRPTRVPRSLAADARCGVPGPSLGSPWFLPRRR